MMAADHHGSSIGASLTGREMLKAKGEKRRRKQTRRRKDEKMKTEDEKRREEKAAFYVHTYVRTV